MPLPAALLLQHAPPKPAWAVFDPIWYLKVYGAFLPPGVASPAALLAHYLRRGGRAGFAPNPLFDEEYYRAAHPEVATLVDAGRYDSGFDHFCRHGHRHCSGHFLFDDALYGALYDDMAPENLAASGFFGRYDHYLRAGQYEQRCGHLLFDGRFYAAGAAAAGEDPARIARHGPFTHFLSERSAAGETAPSVYFDPAWYRTQLEHLPSEIAAAHGGSAIRHYLLGKTGLDPVPEFSESFYLAANPDARAAVAAGAVPSGYRHFLQQGVFELRRPREDLDLAYYRDANAAVRHALNAGEMRDAFAHLRAIGLAAGWGQDEPDLGEPAARRLSLRRARDEVAIFARRKLVFAAAEPPGLAVILVMYDKFELTLRALSGLRDNYAGAIELILVDNGSTDATREIEQVVTGAKVLRLRKNIGYLLACNLALGHVTAAFVLFLNNDVEFGHGAVAAGLSRLADPAIGAVGGKIIRAHGLLQEAGCIVWRDGSAEGYLRDAPPAAPEASFLRDVDFCSGVFLLCRTALVRRLGGFDPAFSPSYYEEADLCRRIVQSGSRVVYDPAIVMHHLEYGSANAKTAATLMRRGQQIFARKHAQWLQTRPDRQPRHLAAARAAPRGRRILFIEDTIPLRRLGSGYVRANDIVRALAVENTISVFPVNGSDRGMLEISVDFPENVELLHDRDIERLAELLAMRPGFFDLVWLSRTHNLSRVLPHFVQAGIEPGTVPIVLDSEAIAASRDAARARLRQEDFDFAAALRQELEAAAICRHCVAVNDGEAELLRRAGLPAAVLGTMVEPDPTAAPFAARAGLLFVAAIHRPDSPNLDALAWFAQAILPALREEMAEVPILNVAGYVAPEIDLRPFAGNARIRLHGPAPSLRAHYESNRVFIAPTRFAAGTPYKLYEAAAQGLPSVTTDLLAQQLGWRDGVEVLSAPVDDAGRFAARIARLYTSNRLWTQLRRNASARIAAENGAAAFRAKLTAIVESACAGGVEQEERKEAAF